MSTWSFISQNLFHLCVCVAGTRPWGEEECKEFEEGLHCNQGTTACIIVNMLCVKTPRPIVRCIAAGY